MLGNPRSPFFRVMAGIAIGSAFLLLMLFIQSRMVADPRRMPFAGVAIFVAMPVAFIVGAVIIVMRGSGGAAARDDSGIEKSPASMTRWGLFSGILGIACFYGGVKALVERGAWPGLLFIPSSVPFIVVAAWFLAAGRGHLVLATQLRRLVLPAFLVGLLVSGTTGALYGEMSVSFMGLPIHLETTQAGRVALAVAWDAIVLAFAWALYRGLTPRAP